MQKVGRFKIGIGELGVGEVGDMAATVAEALRDDTGIGLHPDEGQIRESGAKEVALPIFEECLGDAKILSAAGQRGDALSEQIGKLQAHQWSKR